MYCQYLRLSQFGVNFVWGLIYKCNVFIWKFGLLYWFLCVVFNVLEIINFFFMILFVVLIDYNNIRIKLNWIVSFVSVSNWLDVFLIFYIQDILYMISEVNVFYFCKIKDDICYLL